MTDPKLIGHFSVDPPRSGLDNMALDQAMLEQTAQDSILRVRFYRWIEPTMSLGYFQKFQDFQDYQPASGCPVVRRATGGGAIMHHHDWTYSIAAPSQGLGKQKRVGASPSLYDCVHHAVVDWLCQSGTPAALWHPDHAGNSACETCHFLCFHRRHQGDVVVGEHKVMGSAQRRLQGAVLQHGSLLIARSRFAPTLPGLEEIGGQTNALDLDRLQGGILQRLGNCYEIELKRWESADPLVPVKDRLRQRLESDNWIARI
jgi:lipoyl(octanoyl) transferase